MRKLKNNRYALTSVNVSRVQAKTITTSPYQVTEPQARYPKYPSIKRLSPEDVFVRPLMIRLDVDDSGGFVAYSNTFEMYGMGESEEEAVADLRSLLLSDYENLVNQNSENLDQSAICLLNLYQGFFGRSLHCIPQ